jgi:hypothetical protein
MTSSATEIRRGRSLRFVVSPRTPTGPTFVAGKSIAICAGSSLDGSAPQGHDFGRQIVAVKGHGEKLEVSRSYTGLFKGM